MNYDLLSDLEMLEFMEAQDKREAAAVARQIQAEVSLERAVSLASVPRHPVVIRPVVPVITNSAASTVSGPVLTKEQKAHQAAEKKRMDALIKAEKDRVKAETAAYKESIRVQKAAEKAAKDAAKAVTSAAAKDAALALALKQIGELKAYIRSAGLKLPVLSAV
jgi:type IV secretory pathway VirB10-like protein